MNTSNSAMKIKLNDISETGLTVTDQFNPVDMHLQTQELKFLQPLAVAATFYKERDTVIVRVEALGSLEIICARCLEPYQQPYDNQFDLDYETKGKVALDITDDIRQEVLLSYPIRFLCREDCKGLCSICGKNLNEGVCQHAVTKA